MQSNSFQKVSFRWPVCCWFRTSVHWLFSIVADVVSIFILYLQVAHDTDNKKQTNSVLHTVQRWWSVAQFFFSQRTKETKRWHCLPVCVVTNLSPGPSFCRASDACDASQLSCVNWAGKGGEREKKHNTLTYKKMTFCFVNAEKSWGEWPKEHILSWLNRWITQHSYRRNPKTAWKHAPKWLLAAMEQSDWTAR